MNGGVYKWHEMAVKDSEPPIDPRELDLLDDSLDPYDVTKFQPLPPHRKFWYYADLDSEFGDAYTDQNDMPLRVEACAYDANLISSKTVDGMHAPAIDIDMPIRAIPSRTKGHFHLYIDKPMRWWKYRMLLKVMVWCGIVEPGYYRASKKRKQTFLRWNIANWDSDYGEKEIQVAQLKQIARQTK